MLPLLFGTEPTPRMKKPEAVLAFCNTTPRPVVLWCAGTVMPSTNTRVNLPVPSTFTLVTGPAVNVYGRAGGVAPPNVIVWVIGLANPPPLRLTSKLPVSPAPLYGEQVAAKFALVNPA